jgi:GAF domain-containing protein
MDDNAMSGPDQLSVGVAEAAVSLFTAGDLRAVLERVVALATETIDGCDHAGVFLVEQGDVTAPAATSAVAAELDALQQQFGEGPCLDVVAGGGVVYANDLSLGPPWELWSAAAVKTGVRSVLALAMRGDGRQGALNCYSEYPEAFGALDRGKALVLATLAGLALAGSGGQATAEAKAGNLEAALATRAVIGQAQGILIERERITPDQAFDLLRRSSQHLNVKLRDVAQRLVDTGEDPPYRREPPEG